MSKNEAKKTKGSTKQTHISYVHVDTFTRRKELSLEVARGFKSYLKGQTYQLSMEDFETLFEEYQNREIN